MLFFFFSSRRRHTRFDCDWSSDVCSSDLANKKMFGTPALEFNGLEQRSLASSDQRDFPILLRQRERDGLPHAAAGAGDDCCSLHKKCLLRTIAAFRFGLSQRGFAERLATRLQEVKIVFQ